VLCRNLLIYLQPEARLRLLQQLRGWCVPDGWLFVGHAETQLLRDAGLHALTEPMSFGFRNRAAMPDRRAPARAVAATAQPPRRLASSLAAEPAAAADAPGTASSWREAVHLADSGRLDQAAQSLSAYQQGHPECPHGHALRGELLLAAGDLDSAHHSLHKALYLQPDHVRALTTMLALASRRGDPVLLKRWRERLSRAHTSRHPAPGDDESGHAP
jgi:chemotaxis protein methyltransferase WspC